MIALLLISTFSIGLFILVFWLTKVVTVAKNAISTAGAATQVMRDPALDDLAREQAVQKAAIKLLGSSAALIAGSAVSLGAAFVPIFVADLIEVVPIETSVEFMARWDVIIIATVVVIAGYFLFKRLWSR